MAFAPVKIIDLDRHFSIAEVDIVLINGKRVVGCGLWFVGPASFLRIEDLNTGSEMIPEVDVHDAARIKAYFMIAGITVAVHLCINCFPESGHQ